MVVLQSGRIMVDVLSVGVLVVLRRRELCSHGAMVQRQACHHGNQNGQQQSHGWRRHEHGLDMR